MSLDRKPEFLVEKDPLGYDAWRSNPWNLLVVKYLDWKNTPRVEDQPPITNPDEVARITRRNLLLVCGPALILATVMAKCSQS